MFKLMWRLIKTIISISIIIVILGSIGFAYARFIEPDRLNVTEISDISYSIHEPVTVAIFADTHFGFDYTTDDFQNVIDVINKKSPDFILFAGDLIDYLDKYEGDTALISQKLSELNADTGKYAA